MPDINIYEYLSSHFNLNIKRIKYFNNYSKLFIYIILKCLFYPFKMFNIKSEIIIYEIKINSISNILFFGYNI